MRPKSPVYTTPDNQRCPDCGEPCTIIALDDSFDYSGTHCTGGIAGTYYPSDCGTPVSDCCESPIPDAEIESQY